MISQEAIRERSYRIWQREGCPDGKAVEHWFRARVELEAEYRAARFPDERNSREIVVPRVSISVPPQRLMSRRVSRPAA
jgi:hypothetical protein